MKVYVIMSTYQNETPCVEEVFLNEQKANHYLEQQKMLYPFYEYSVIEKTLNAEEEKFSSELKEYCAQREKDISSIARCPRCGSTAQVKLVRVDYETESCDYRCGCGLIFTY